MNVLLIGRENRLSRYITWIEEAFDALVRTCDYSEKRDLPLLKKEWDLVVVNFDSQYDPGELLRIVRSSRPETPVFAISENLDDRAEEAVDAMRAGVADYFSAPVEKERLLDSMRKVMLETGPRKGSSEPIPPGRKREGIAVLGKDVLFEGSGKMQAIKQVVEKILDTDLPVLITGESGTGKEMIAQYIHAHSRRGGPFVKVNCAAIPSELLESELFGYERGAFTGAYKRKPGKFEAADGGFLFLDEISELSYPLQSKLLHVLQDVTVTTLGSTREVPVDVRIIAATNQNLEKCVRSGTFRDDLFFRLNVVHLNVPPLRDRLDHLAVLIDYFREKYAIEFKVKPINLSPEARSFLYTYPWPGNIRELENAIRRATVLGDETFLEHGEGGSQLENSTGGGLSAGEGGDLSVPSLPVQGSQILGPEEMGAKSPTEQTLSLKEIAKEAALEAEKEAIARVLQQTRWNRKKTARILDVSYKTLLTKIKETGLDEK